MRSTFTLLLSFTLLALAVPFDKRTTSTIQLTKKNDLTTDGAVNTKALEAHIDHVKSKYARSFDVYERNAGTSHPNARRSTVTSAKHQTGSVPLKEDSDAFIWQGSITVGTPPVTFTVDIDTTVSDLFLASVGCDSTCDGHTKYDPSKSTTSYALNKTFSISLENNTHVSGNEFTDVVNVGGLTAYSQVLGAATTAEGFQLPQFPPDGLLGLGWPENAILGTPFFNTLIQQGSVAKGEFGVKLADEGSELFLGGVNHALVGGDFTTVDVTEKGFWQVNTDSINVGQRAVLKNVQTIIDVGTAVIIGDTDSVKTFYAAIEGSKSLGEADEYELFSFPCDSNPQVSLTFAGKNFDFSEEFNLGPVSAGSSDCVGGVLSEDLGFDGWIVGGVFLKTVYTVFSFDDATVSFAPLA